MFQPNKSTFYAFGGLLDYYSYFSDPTHLYNLVARLFLVERALVALVFYTPHFLNHISISTDRQHLR